MNRLKRSRWLIAGLLFFVGLIFGFGFAAMIFISWTFILSTIGSVIVAAFNIYPLIAAGTVLIATAIFVVSPIGLAATTFLCFCLVKQSGNFKENAT